MSFVPSGSVGYCSVLRAFTYLRRSAQRLEKGPLMLGRMVAPRLTFRGNSSPRLSLEDGREMDGDRWWLSGSVEAINGNIGVEY